MFKQRFIILVALWGLAAHALAVQADEVKNVQVRAGNTAIDFERDVRPIFMQHCYACHGPDASQRKADLRLDSRAIIFSVLPSGKQPIVPSDTGRSAVIQRISALAEDQRMPPPAYRRALSQDQIATLTRWVEQGAPWRDHWAYQPVLRPLLPPVRNPQWARNPIDYYVEGQRSEQGMLFSPEGDRAKLLRRVSFTLTGLPPTPQELKDFLSHPSPMAYEKAVERLLSSPRYGEHMATWWLDLARYADTHGYHIDSHRDMWRWRDWVIHAFNSNMPFDQFTVEQQAGDLLPNATLEQKIATGFNRNNMINFENGALADEYLVEYAADRVVTTATVWLAQTMQCARCHDHKFDPFLQQDFYSLFAYFNQLPEKGLDGEKGNAAPFIETPTELQRQQLASFDAEIQSLEAQVRQRMLRERTGQMEWERSLVSAAGVIAEPPRDSELWLTFDAPDVLANRGTAHVEPKSSAGVETLPGRIGKAGQFNGEVGVEVSGLAAIDHDHRFTISFWMMPTTAEDVFVLGCVGNVPTRRGWEVRTSGGSLRVALLHDGANAIEIRARERLKLRKWQHLCVTYDASGAAAGLRVFVDGQPQSIDMIRDALAGSFSTAEPLQIGRESDDAGLRGLLDEVQLFRRQITDEEVRSLAGSDPIRDILSVPPERRNKDQLRIIREHYLEKYDAEYQQLRLRLQVTQKNRELIRRTVPTTMVMQDVLPPRATHILLRGRYDAKGPPVRPSPPAALMHPTSYDLNDRLGLSKWLVDSSNPLTSRVLVNRLWEFHFGIGLVRTSEDFGTRGELPSHPELLDWLASELVRSGWDLKHLHRLIVTSSTYRQSSRVTPELLSKDPQNRFLARGPRLRLSAESIRDNALIVSGLWCGTLGGPSVKPYQPVGLWEEVSYDPDRYSAQVYVPDKGSALYRRSLYTFWKRSVPPPGLAAFDAPDREVCCVSRSRTNTPLQALVLMNDPTFAEAAQALAQRILLEGGAEFRSQLELAYRLTVSRLPSDSERNVFREMFEKQWHELERRTVAGDERESVTGSVQDETSVHQAVWTILANTLLCLDETITNE